MIGFPIRNSAKAAASASFRMLTLQPVPALKNVFRSFPRHSGCKFGAFSTLVPLNLPGKPTPIGPSKSNRLIIFLMPSSALSGSDSFVNLNRTFSEAKVPALMSTNAALIAEPPISIPNRIIFHLITSIIKMFFVCYCKIVSARLITCSPKKQII